VAIQRTRAIQPSLAERNLSSLLWCIGTSSKVTGTVWRLTLALSGGAAVVSAKPAGNKIGGHYDRPDSGPVRFNALLAVFARSPGEWADGSRPAGTALATAKAMDRSGRPGH
jgi:hypothetical protein